MYIPDFSEIMAVAHSHGCNSAAPWAWNGLVGSWPMQEGGGITGVYDVAGRQQHGLLAGFVSADRIAGSQGLALNFNDSDNNLNLGDIRGSFGTEASFVIWVRRVTHSPGSWPGCWKIHGLFANNQCHYIKDGTIYDSTFNDVRTGFSTAISDTTEWHQVAITQKPGAGNWQFRQNLSLAGTATGAATIQITETSWIGFNRLSTFFDGEFTNARLWNRVLSPGEIAQVYADPLGMHRLFRQILFPAVVVGDLSIPIAMHHYKQMMGVN